MLDAMARRALDPWLDGAAGRLDRWRWLTPNHLTLLGLAAGLASAATAATQHWTAALACWLGSRLADGLDGPLARHRKRRTAAPGADSEAGGFLDISADFVVYGSTVVGVAVGAGGPAWPYLAVLLAYYVNGTAFLAFSSIAERTGRTLEDGRSLSFLGGLAEGTETVIVHAAWLLLPAFAGQIATGWAVVVGLSGLHRIWAGYRLLR